MPGMGPMEAIKAGTSVSAEELGVDKRTGSIRVGYEADFVVIDRSPLENIRHIGDVVMVVNNGRIALNRLNVTAASVSDNSENLPSLRCCATLAMRVDFGYAEKEIKTGYCSGEDSQSLD